MHGSPLLATVWVWAVRGCDVEIMTLAWFISPQQVPVCSYSDRILDTGQTAQEQKKPMQCLGLRWELPERPYCNVLSPICLFHSSQTHRTGIHSPPPAWTSFIVQEQAPLHLNHHALSSVNIAQSRCAEGPPSLHTVTVQVWYDLISCAHKFLVPVWWWCFRRLPNAVQTQNRKISWKHYEIWGFIVSRVCSCPWRPEEVLDLWQLEFQVVGNHPTWVLGTELRISARALYTLKHWAIFQTD